MRQFSESPPDRVNFVKGDLVSLRNPKEMESYGATENRGVCTSDQFIVRVAYDCVQMGIGVRWTGRHYGSSSDRHSVLVSTLRPYSFFLCCMCHEERPDFSTKERWARTGIVVCESCVQKLRAA